MKYTGTRNDLGGLIIVLFLMMFGIGALYFLFINWDFSWSGFIDIFYKDGMLIIFYLFFIIIGIYGITLSIKDKLASERNTLAVLTEINDINIYDDMNPGDGYIIVFQDKKGEKYYFKTTVVNPYEEKKVYNIVVKNKLVIKINEELNAEFIEERSKENFWLTLYLPHNQKFENLMLLPILYVIFLPFLLSVLISKGTDKIYGLIPSVLIGYFIIYDIYQKIKNKQ